MIVPTGTQDHNGSFVKRAQPDAIPDAFHGSHCYHRISNHEHPHTEAQNPYNHMLHSRQQPQTRHILDVPRRSVGNFVNYQSLRMHEATEKKLDKRTKIKILLPFHFLVIANVYVLLRFKSLHMAVKDIAANF